MACCVSGSFSIDQCLYVTGTQAGHGASTVPVGAALSPVFLQDSQMPMPCVKCGLWAPELLVMSVTLTPGTSRLPHLPLSPSPRSKEGVARGQQPQTSVTKHNKSLFLAHSDVKWTLLVRRVWAAVF